jgi:hypothetical protein
MAPDHELTAALTRRPLPPAFERWRVELPAGAEHPADPGDWAGALVLVEHGVLEVDCDAAGRRTFRQGDLLVLGWLPLRTLRNPGTEPTRLLAVRRRRARPADPFLRVVRAARARPRHPGPE